MNDRAPTVPNRAPGHGVETVPRAPLFTGGHGHAYQSPPSDNESVPRGGEVCVACGASTLACRGKRLHGARGCCPTCVSPDPCQGVSL